MTSRALGYGRRRSRTIRSEESRRIRPPNRSFSRSAPNPALKRAAPKGVRRNSWEHVDFVTYSIRNMTASTTCEELIGGATGAGPRANLELARCGISRRPDGGLMMAGPISKLSPPITAPFSLLTGPTSEAPSAPDERPDERTDDDGDVFQRARWRRRHSFARSADGGGGGDGSSCAIIKQTPRRH